MLILQNSNRDATMWLLRMCKPESSRVFSGVSRPEYQGGLAPVLV